MLRSVAVMRVALGLAVALAAASIAQPQAPAIPPAYAEGFPKGVRLDAGDLADLARGQVIVREIRGTADQESGAFGIALLRVPYGALLDLPQRPELMVETQGSSFFHWLPDYPGPEDFDGLALLEQDYRDLPKCKPGGCNVKLSVPWILRFRKELGKDGAGTAQRALALYKQMLSERALGYQRRGDAALGWAGDKKRPVSLRDEVRGIVTNAASLRRAFPRLHAYLLRYPDDPPPGARSRLYTMRGTLGGGKPVVSLQHAVDYRPSANTAPVWVSKQLQASHYLEAGLTFTYAIPTAQADAVYLVHEQRLRIDVLRGWGLFHGRIRSGVRRLVGDRLESARDAIERFVDSRGIH